MKSKLSEHLRVLERYFLKVMGKTCYLYLYKRASVRRYFILLSMCYHFQSKQKRESFCHTWRNKSSVRAVLIKISVALSAGKSIS